MARLRLAQWDNAIADCNECLRLSPDSMKAHYNLSQAHLALRAFDDALKHALRAHELCVKQADKSLATITSHVLKCKKERWEAMEKKRLREISGLEGEVMAVLQRERDRLLQDESLTEIQRKELEDEWQSKLERMREVFERARPKEEKKRVVPDWAIDDISFCVMVDPVIVSIIFAQLLHPDVLDEQAFAWQIIEELWRISDMNPCDRLKQASPTSARPSSSTCAALRPIPSLGSPFASLTCDLIWTLSKLARSSSLRMDGPLTGRLGSQKFWCLLLGCGQHSFLTPYLSGDLFFAFMSAAFGI